MRVAIAECREAVDSPPDQLYPDPDGERLRPALLASGASEVELLSWDDPDVAWSSYDVVFVSGTWDSVDRPDESLAWTRSLPLVLNPYDVIAWNLDKRYLQDLEAAGLPIVPTTWISAGDDVTPSSLPPGELVVKPAVSAGGRSTAWYGVESRAAAVDHVASLQASGATVMVQQHVAGVATVGEIKSVYVDGVASHAARVGGLLDRDAGIMERPWEKSVPVSAAVPSAVERTVADAVVAELARRFGEAPVYARVDLVLDTAGAPRVLEVELIDPLLFLEHAPPDATERLAAAILRRAAAGR